MRRFEDSPSSDCFFKAKISANCSIVKIHFFWCRKTYSTFLSILRVRGCLEVIFFHVQIFVELKQTFHWKVLLFGVAARHYGTEAVALRSHCGWSFHRLGILLLVRLLLPHTELLRKLMKIVT